MLKILLISAAVTLTSIGALEADVADDYCTTLGFISGFIFIATLGAMVYSYFCGGIA